ncbi:hypothetical protein BGZ65_000971 [Modicella reniformis]|uniref:Uncharacterized protein n=1 Tax=Modicella reniformis TaxID=1440133 RepID=A0A9P6SNQ8_9FUNG|nr:hypothetical protein BGZ65_000971 [Modicella reniformis]
MNAIPGTTLHGQPMERIDMGETEVPQEVFMEFIDNLRESFTADAYHLLDNNCNNFSNEVCQFLVGNPIPSKITSLPQDFLETPFGQMMRPMIENMFGPSRHTPSPTPVPTQFPVPASSSSATTPPTAAVPFVSDLAQLQKMIRNNTAAVVYFTSATCPPCRVIAPIYDELVLSKGKQIAGVKVDIGMAQAIGRAYEVRSTPTFMFFLRGEKFSQFSGANQAELRSSIELLIYSAHPAHPHTFLSLNHFKELPRNPILLASLESVDPVFAKLKTFLPTAEKGLSEMEMKQLDKIHTWLKRRNTAKREKTTAEPTLGELGPAWKPLLGKIIELVPYENQFPVLDILRMLILHERIAEVYAKDGNMTLVNLFKAVAEKGNDGSKPRALMTLRIACNAFDSPLLGTYVLSSVARESTKQLLVATLLSPVDQQRQTAASLAFNIGAKIAESRSKVRDTTTPSISGGPLEALEEDWNVECLSAIATAIGNEDSEETLYRLVASIANFIYKDDNYTGSLLMDTLGLPETLESKIQNKVIKGAKVAGLCRDVQEMIRTGVAKSLA